MDQQTKIWARTKSKKIMTESRFFITSGLVGQESSKGKI